MTFLKSLFSFGISKEKTKKPETESRNEITNLKEYKIGDLIGGKWKIYRILGGEGKSGMGIVYVCMNNDKQILALKTFQTAFLDSKEMKDNFRREALAWVHLEKHPYIVRAELVHELDYRLFIFLEFVTPDEYGRNTLTHYLKEPISAQQASEWAIQFCYGMEHAASCGVTPHRDIKPDNIMITANKILKITDFGLAKLFSSSGKVLETKAESQESGSKLSFIRTSGGKEIVGTLPWMAPEQFEGETDVKSDIYSFGLVMYQMMNRGNLPFYARSIKGFEDAHKNAAVPKLNTKLFPIIARCLEKNPINRYSDFNSLRMDLEALYSKETGKKPTSLPEKIELEAWEYSNKGVSFYNLGFMDDAFKELRQAIAMKPDDAEAHCNIGNVLHAKGQLDDAIKAYRQAIAIQPDFAGAHNNMGVVLADKGQLDDAIKAFRQAIAIQPDCANVYSNMGVVLADKGQLDDAIKAYRQAIAIKPDCAETHHNMGNALKDKGHLDDAIKEFRQAIAIKLDYADAHFNMGNAFAAKGHLDDAIKEFRQAIAIKPDYADAHCNTGIAFAVKGQLDDAIKAYREALAVKPNLAEAHFHMGNAFAAKGHLDDAIKEFRQAIAIKSDYATAHHNMGGALAAKGRLDDAIKEFRQAITIKPDIAEAYVNIGSAFQDKGQLDDAIKAYEQAIAIKPDFGAAYSNMGLVFAMKGQWDDAIKAYRLGLALKSEFDFLIYSNMGIALAEVGKLNEAIDAYKNFIKYAPPQYSQHIEQVKQKIQDLQSRL